MEKLLRNLLGMEIGETRTYNLGELTTELYRINDNIANVGCDLFCSTCNSNKTYSIVSEKTKSSMNYYASEFPQQAYQHRNNAVFSMNINCSFNIVLKCPICGNYAYMNFMVENNAITKIGVWPEQFDGLRNVYNKYKQIKSPTFDYRIEFTTGLYIYNKCKAGIGAFSYLRRCLENLVVETIEDYKKQGKINDEDIENAKRFSDKIDLVKDSFDTEIQEMLKPLYGILSKGIHQLDEDECLKDFELLKDVVELLLDDKLTIIEKAKKKKEMKEKLIKKSNELS